MKRVTVLIAAIAIVAMGAAYAERNEGAITAREPIPIMTVPTPQDATNHAVEGCEVYTGSSMDG